MIADAGHWMTESGGVRIEPESGGEILHLARTQVRKSAPGHNPQDGIGSRTTIRPSTHDAFQTAYTGSLRRPTPAPLNPASWLRHPAVRCGISAPDASVARTSRWKTP